MHSLEFYKAKKKELHLTNDKVSEISGLPKRTVEDFFAGISKDPRASPLEAIERALGIYLDDTTREEITVQEYRLLTAFRELDDTTRELVVLLVDRQARGRIHPCLRRLSKKGIAKALLRSAALIACGASGRKTGLSPILPPILPPKQEN